MNAERGGCKVRFKGKTVVVTGAGSGIGRAVALGYAAEGADAVLVDRNRAGADETASLIHASGGSCSAWTADLGKPEDIAALFAGIKERYGRADILINNAGISAFKSIWELEVEEWDEVLNTNLRGAFLCSRAAALLMKANGRGGSIVNMASTRAFMSEPSSEAYAASKGGILSLTHALALSLGEEGIRVNSVSPGWIETGSTAGLSEADHKQHPAGRVGLPEDVVRACFYLTDPDNDFVTGTNVTVDGGMTRKMIYID